MRKASVPYTKLKEELTQNPEIEDDTGHLIPWNWLTVNTNTRHNSHGQTILIQSNTEKESE